MNLTGRTVLITGGGSGIGRGLAEALYAMGNTVIVAGRRLHLLENLAAAHPGMRATALDITDPANIARVVSTVAQTHPELDGLVDNAGVMLNTDLTRPVADDDLERTVATNLLGPIRLISALIQHLRARPSAGIVNVSSMLAYAPLARAPLYSATKSALHSYTLSLRHQLQATNIEVIEIAPLFSRTALQPINLTDPRAMPLNAFIRETVAAMAAGEPEPYVEVARQRRDAQRTGDIAATQRLNELMR